MSWNPLLDLTGFFNDWLFFTRWGAIIAEAKQPADLFKHYQR